MKKYQNLRKMTAILLACMFTFLMLYFSVFEVTHIIHDCSGADCPVCHELQIANSMVKQLGSLLICAIVEVFFVRLVLHQSVTNVCPFSGRNLILDKVRMDN